MRRFATLVGLALRELWISYRLLAMLGALLLAALPVALLPSQPTVVAGTVLDRTTWYAIGLGAALAPAAGVAAASLAGDLRRGTIAWLALRAVPRTTALLAWFGALALVVALGLVLSTALVALSVPGLAPSERVGAYVAAIWALVATGLAATAAGILVGTLLRPLAASLVSIVLVGILLLATSVALPAWPASVPAAGLAVLAGFDAAARPIGDALRSAGTALALAGGLLVLAAARVERVDL